MEGTEQLEQQIKAWVNKTAQAIAADMVAKGVKHRDNSTSVKALTDSIKGKTAKSFGIVNKVSIVFPRHLVFVKYGVGKYRAKGSGKEKPKEIVDNVITANIEELADIAANGYADIACRNLFINKNR